MAHGRDPVQRDAQIRVHGVPYAQTVRTPSVPQTSVTIELTAPVEHVFLLGRRRRVRLVRFHAEDGVLVRALTRG